LAMCRVRPCSKCPFNAVGFMDLVNQKAQQLVFGELKFGGGRSASCLQQAALSPSSP
jgi:hypothetical protein